MGNRSLKMKKILFVVTILTSFAVQASNAAAKEVFTQRCMICHGESGKGDGPIGKSMNPNARDFSNQEWQKSVTDQQIEKVIKEGGASLGKSPNMPASPDLSNDIVKNLVKLIRSFKD